MKLQRLLQLYIRMFAQQHCYTHSCMDDCCALALSQGRIISLSLSTLIWDQRRPVQLAVQPRPCEFSKYPPKHDVAEWLTIQTLCDSERKGLGLKIQMGLYGSIGAQSDRGHTSQKKGCIFFI